MKKNMGHTDQVIRILIALGVLILYSQEMIEGTPAYILLALAAIFVITGFVRFCPLYRLFGIRTCRLNS